MNEKHNKLPLRVVLAAAGMLLTGISIGFFKRSLFGVDPYQCFANGLANVIPIRFGTLYMLVNLVQLAVVFFLDRHYIGISTFLNLFLLGYIVEFSESLLTRLYPDPTLAIRIAFLIIGVVVTCIAAALYYTADLGVSTSDAIPLHISDRKTIEELSALLVRTHPAQPVDAAQTPLCVLEESNADGTTTRVTVWRDGKDVIFASSADAQSYRVPGAAAEFCRLTGLPEN